MSLSTFLALLVSLGSSSAFLVFVVAALWFYDRYDREPLSLVVGVFLWGALMAPAASVVVSAVAGHLVNLSLGSGDPSATLVNVVFLAPLVEEGMKGIALVAVFVASRHFDNPTDGLVYGSAVGIGFAVTENMLYGLGAALSMELGAMLGLVLARTLFSAGVHALACSCFGGFIGAARLERRPLLRGLWLSLGFAAAVALHSTWNLAALRFLAGTAEPIPWLLGLISLYALFLVLLSLFLAAEHRILLRELTEEVALGVLPDWVVDIIPYYLRRVRAGWWPARSERTVISRLLTRLAFRKHEVRRVTGRRRELAGLEVVRIRGRIRGILDPGVSARD